MYSFKSQKNFLWFIGGILFVSYIWIGYNMLASGQDGITLCLINRFLGIPCPGCGLTRAVIAFCHGNLVSAIQLNPLVLIVAPALVITPIALAIMPRESYILFTKAEDFFSKRTGIIILCLSIVTLWTYLIIHNI